MQSEIRVTLHNQKYYVKYYAFSFLASGDSFIHKVVQACVCLHNYLVEDRPIAQMLAELNPEQHPFMHGNGIMRPIPRLPGYISANDTQQVQDIYKDYFNSPQGSVSWQQRRVSYRIR